MFFCYFCSFMTKLRKLPITVGLISLGCPKNVIDSERMLAQIAQDELLVTPETDNIDVIIINTCGFIAPAEFESLEAIRDAAKRKRCGTIKKVIVTGCLCERLGEELLNKVDDIDGIVGLINRDNIGRIIKEVLSSDKPRVYIDKHKTHDNQLLDDRTRLLTTPGHWAYLRISEGCNHRCSFCTIPSIRGKFRSKAPELVLAEARELVTAGAVELNIVAQDTTFYGKDLKNRTGLVELLTGMEEIDKLEWIRLMYLYPTGINEKLIQTIAESKKVVHYLDIPLQHISDEILKSMRRPDTGERLQKLIESLRNEIPDIVLRTTMIVGYPGETDKQFSELIDFIIWARFDALGCFKFYPEAGTAAAAMPDQVADEIKQHRFDELMGLQQKIAFEKNEERIGSRLTCLVDSVDTEGFAGGRFYGQAPEIDSICLVDNCTAEAGRFIETKVAGTEGYDLRVKQIRN